VYFYRANQHSQKAVTLDRRSVVRRQKSSKQAFKYWEKGGKTHWDRGTPHRRVKITVSMKEKWTFVRPNPLEKEEGAGQNIFRTDQGGKSRNGHEQRLGREPAHPNFVKDVEQRRLRPVKPRRREGRSKEG